MLVGRKVDGWMDGDGVLGVEMILPKGLKIVELPFLDDLL